MNWDEIDQLRKGPERPLNSFNREEYQERYGLGLSAARQQLTKLVKDGKLKKTIIIVDKATVPFYTAVKLEQDGVHSGNGRRRSKRARKSA